MSNARKLADNLPTEGSLSGRNVIVNGAMQVAQRGTSSTGLGADTSTYHTVDRWKIITTGTAGRFTMTQDSSAPVGFANSTKFECTTADTSVAAGEFFFFEQRIEGQDLQRFAKGTPGAKQFAVSFYVKGNANATYVVELIDQDNSYRHVNKTFNVTTDWTRVELIFPADTTGTLDDDNNASLDLNIWLHAGSTFTSGTLQETWGALNQANRAVGISSIFDSTARTFFITGVQLEAGPQSTPFEHELASVTLNKCHRYFMRYNGNIELIGQAYHPDSNDITVPLPSVMRATPTITTKDAANNINKASVYQSGAYNHNIATARSSGRTRENIVMMRQTGSLSPAATTDDAVQVQFNDFQADAEL